MSTNASGSSPGLVCLPTPLLAADHVVALRNLRVSCPTAWLLVVSRNPDRAWLTLIHTCRDLLIAARWFPSVCTCTNCCQGQCLPNYQGKSLSGKKYEHVLLVYACLFVDKIYACSTISRYIYFPKHTWYVTFKGMSYSCSDVLIIISILFT